MVAIAGTSRAMIKVREKIERIGTSPLRVMLIGEGGTGKRLVASEIHRVSCRPGPFVVVPCSELWRELEMHWRSRFERAAEGSLYFDEIAHLPADAQGLLSRLIDSGFPARILCATRESPWETIRRGFKRHLYDRLVEELIELPPLRRRIEDIGPIGQSMLDNAQLTPRAVEVLRSHDWPGNGHELNDLLTPLDVLREVDAVDLRERLKMAAGDREWLEGVLWSHRGNVTAAAARIGVRRQELHRRIRRLGIPRGCGRENVA